MATTKSKGQGLSVALTKVAAKLAKKGTLRMGFLEKAKYPDGTSVAMVAAIQDAGAPKVGIPPRPFFRNMVRTKKSTWGPSLKGILKANPGIDIITALRQLGDGMRGQLQNSIRETNDPPLSKVTLMLRKMRSQNQGLVVNGTVVAEARARVEAGESVAGVPTKPLIDTTYMINSVDSEVTE